MKRSLPANAAARRSLLLALVLWGLSACSLAYVPLVPEGQVWEPRLELRGSEGLAVEDGRLRLTLTLSEVPEPGWLVLQWFGPGRAQASDSLWVEPESVGEERTAYLPDDIRLTPGPWRVVVSFDSVVARQFSLTVE